MKQIVTPELLHKYVDGNCTPQEVQLIHQWYDSFDDDAADPLADLGVAEQLALKSLLFNKFKATVNLQNQQPLLIPSKRGGSAKLIYAIAGIAALLLLVVGIYFSKKEAVNVPDSAFLSQKEEMVINNKTNTIYKQTLSDGSIVWLSAKSSLEFPVKFAGNYREVKMTGEAFFEVTKDHSHPFIIYSGGVITRVWGTSFRIRAYQNVPTEVSVVTGKVSVKLPEREGSEVMLFPKQKAIYNRSSHFLTSTKETSKSALRIWQKASVSFDNMPLDDVLNTLENHFGTRIYTNDKELGKYLLKADFTDQNLPAILEMLESSLNVTYTIDDTEIELYRKP